MNIIITSTMKYIFIIYLFDIVVVTTFDYKNGQT
jgi:hypothetical protein